MVAVINVDAYPFFGFLRPDLSHSGYGNRCFLVALYRLIVRRPNLEVAARKLLHQQVEIHEVVFVPCSRMEVRPCNYFWWCGYF